jgi:hypothetical protein
MTRKTRSPKPPQKPTPTQGPIVRNDPKRYKRLGEVARMFGITASTIRNREADGTIPRIPRNAAGDRLIPFEWVSGWIQAGGFPGPRPTDDPLPMPTPTGAPRAVVPGAESLSPSAVPGETEAGAPLGDPPPDDVYRRESNRAQRYTDDAAAIRAQLELKRAQRELDEFDKPRVNPVAPDTPLVSALVQQNTELMKLLVGNRSDPVETAVKILTAVKAAGSAGDRDRPESRLYDTLAQKMVDRVGDKLFEPQGDDSAPSFLLELAKVAAPVVAELLKAPRGVPVVDRGPGNRGGVAPVVPELPGPPGVDDLARDASPVPGSPGEQPESGGDVSVVGDVFEMIVNLYEGQVSTDDATQALYQVIGTDPPAILRRLIGAPVSALKILGIGAGVRDFADLVDTEAGREWVSQVQQQLSDIYTGGG